MSVILQHQGFQCFVHQLIWPRPKKGRRGSKFFNNSPVDIHFNQHVGGTERKRQQTGLLSRVVLICRSTGPNDGKPPAFIHLRRPNINFLNYAFKSYFT